MRTTLENERNPSTGDPWSASVSLVDVQVSSNLVVATLVGIEDTIAFEVGFDALRGHHGLWNHTGE